MVTCNLFTPCHGRGGTEGCSFCTSDSWQIFRLYPKNWEAFRTLDSSSLTNNRAQLRVIGNQHSCCLLPSSGQMQSQSPHFRGEIFLDLAAVWVGSPHPTMKVEGYPFHPGEKTGFECRIFVCLGHYPFSCVLFLSFASYKEEQSSHWLIYQASEFLFS